MQPKIISPSKVNQHVEGLLTKMGAEFEPEQVLVKPETFAGSNNCFFDVKSKVEKDGGRVHYGWAIFQSQIICEAERHAVWEDLKGDLIIL